MAARTAQALSTDVDGAHVVEEEPGRLVHLCGRLDVRSVPDVREALHRAVDGGTGDLVAGLGQTRIGDATGLGVLVGAHRRALRQGRRLVLDDVPPPVLRLLRATKLHRVLPMAPTRPGQTWVVREPGQNNRALPSSSPRRAS